MNDCRGNEHPALPPLCLRSASAITGATARRTGVSCLLAAILLGLSLPTVASENGTIQQDKPAEDPRAASTSDRPYEQLLLRGQVDFWGAFLADREDLTLVPEAQERLLMMRTHSGDLYPILEDARGRAFRSDSRLRQRDVGLIVRRFRNPKLLQVLRVFSPREDERASQADRPVEKQAAGTETWDELVYWCDVCAITMFELKPCDCCQGPIELQRREVRPQPVPEKAAK